MISRKDVKRILGPDRELIEGLAEIVEKNMAGPPSKPVPNSSPSQPPAQATRKPTPPAKPKAKTKTAKKEGKPMRQKSAKPRGIEIHAIDDPVPRENMMDRINRRYVATPKRESSASDVDGVTPCRVCGGGVERGGRTFGPWRQHRACEGLSARGWTRVSVAAQALGLSAVDDAVALRMTYRVPTYSEQNLEPTYDKKRASKSWAHVDKKALTTAIEEAETERAESLIPRACADGWCAWCGVEESLSWFNHKHKRTDGSPAPLCVSCSAIYKRRGSPSPAYWDDQRGGISEAITGVEPQLAQTFPSNLLAAAEATQEGDGEAWSHLPSAAVESYRWAQWTRFGGRCAPIEHREEAMRRSREGDLAKAWATAAKNRVPDAFGFDQDE